MTARHVLNAMTRASPSIGVPGSSVKYTVPAAPINP
jgi:hypothetical protein